jgi:glycerol-3-phosphate dehydrogenase
MDDDAVGQLCRNYGSCYGKVLELAKGDPGLGRVLGDTKVLSAEVVHAVRDEMALKLGDVVLRRTDLGAGAYPGDEAVRRCADLMASELGWSPDRRQSEIDELKAGYPGWV